jgi:hypothetical protein
MTMIPIIGCGAFNPGIRILPARILPARILPARILPARILPALRKSPYQLDSCPT